MNPFTDYLPMYPADTLPERPWWSWDGPYGTNPETGAYEAGSLYRRGSVRHWVASTADQIAALDAYDAAHPLPVPKALGGQVWAWASGDQQMVVRAYGSGAAMLERYYGPKQWPPLNAVLVAGIGAPWAPVGWRP